jgi:exopolysaccharide production protein ExoY
MRNIVDKETLDIGNQVDTIDTLDYRHPRSWIRFKRIVDPLLAIILLVFASPIMFALWILSRLDGGPSFYVHTRVGRLGREFGCLKFRTMVVDADAVLARHLAENPAAQLEWEASRKLVNDPRVTWVGRFMRATSLDELPQLLNVLIGDMSLVGPRPVVRAELSKFYNPEGRNAYLRVRPGLTGLWQVSGRSDVDYARRVALDTEYVRSASLGLDVQILFRTVAIVLLQKGAR